MTDLITGPDMSVELCGVRFKNPLIAASGTFGFGREYDRLYDSSLWGGVSVKGLTLAPRAGNAPHRVAETASGMLNSVGLQNPGVEAFINDELPWLRTKDLAVIANIAGSTEEDYCGMAERLAACPVDLLELNISCPNVKEGGVQFGTRPEKIFAVTRAVKRHSRQPLMVKLSPNTADIAEAALAAEEGGADAVSLINTLTGMAIDVRTRRPVLGNIVGGLSGPAILPVALRMVWQASRAVKKIPVVGMGGITTGRDAAAFLLAGARAVMVGTANLIDPMAGPRILRELKDEANAQSLKSVSEWVGALET
jgi:dihydroorotate dehydrogenase (NAD+) catalytic subunit